MFLLPKGEGLVVGDAVQRGSGYDSEYRTPVVTRCVKAPLGTGKSYTESITVSHKQGVTSPLL